MRRPARPTSRLQMLVGQEVRQTVRASRAKFNQSIGPPASHKPAGQIQSIQKPTSQSDRAQPPTMTGDVLGRLVDDAAGP